MANYSFIDRNRQLHGIKKRLAAKAQTAMQ